MWLIYNRISWYHKFAKTEYVTVPDEVNIERERFNKMKVFGNFAESHG